VSVCVGERKAEHLALVSCCLPPSSACTDKIIAALSAAEGSKLTGPAVDLKLRLDVAKLKALQAALDKVDEAIKALPTPSQVRAMMQPGQESATAIINRHPYCYMVQDLA